MTGDVGPLPTLTARVKLSSTPETTSNGTWRVKVGNLRVESCWMEDERPTLRMSEEMRQGRGQILGEDT